MDNTLAKQALDKIQKQAEEIIALKAELVALRNAIASAGVEKSIGIKISKSTATNSWDPVGAKSRLTKAAKPAAEPDESNTVKSAVRKALEGV